MIKIAQTAMYNAKINSIPTTLSADIDASVTTIPITDIRSIKKIEGTEQEDGSYEGYGGYRG